MLTGQGLSSPQAALHELVEVDLKRTKHDSPKPLLKVPGLVDGEGVIYESAIIDEYLEEKFPKSGHAVVALEGAHLGRLLRRTRLHAAASDITHNREPEKAQQRMKQHLMTLDKERQENISSATFTRLRTHRSFRSIRAGSAMVSL